MGFSNSRFRIADPCRLLMLLLLYHAAHVLRVHVYVTNERIEPVFLGFVVRIGIENRGSNTATYTCKAGMMLAYMPAQPYVALLFLGLCRLAAGQGHDMSCICRIYGQDM
jgi:hypothetical protein